ncbi:MAG: DUF262 domain-containing HNH endonuclease family protein, partial [Rhodospirillales bacterium]
MSDTNTLLRLEAHEKTIASVFSEEYAFSIPSYQRPYAWEREQVEELIADLKDAMAPDSPSNGFYFLGSIVLVKTHAGPDAKVVDGQQRLTTLTILFSVLRDLTENQVTRIGRDKYVKQAADTDRKLDEKLRLHLRRQDQPFFEDTIQSNGATDDLPSLEAVDGSKARIVENAMIIRDELKNMEEEERTALIQFLLTNCFLVVVEVPTDTAARRIFTVLNARGLDLTATDILKADLLERAGPKLEESLSERWENIETSHGRSEFNDLFVFVRMIYQRDKPRTALEDGFPVEVKSFKGEPKEFLNSTLEPYSNALLLAGNEKDLAKRFGSQTVGLMRSLYRLDNNDWMPPLLLALRQYSDGDEIDIPEFVFKLERLAYFLFVTRANVNERIARYADVLQELDPDEKAKERSAGLLLEEQEAHAFFYALHRPIYTVTRVVKPLLLRLDQASSDTTATYDIPIISVEHVCPQTIREGSQWDNWFEDRDEHTYWVHRLGNLLLLDRRKNSAASNWD